jgi:hypothetical protein
MQLLFHKTEKSYYLFFEEKDNSNCFVCKQPLGTGDYVFVHKSWGKTGLKKYVYCRKCVKKHRARVYDEFTPTLIVDRIPDSHIQEIILVTDKKPSLHHSSDVSCLDIEKINQANPIHKTNNNCKVAYDPNRNMQIETKDPKQITEERIKMLDAPNITEKQMDEALLE